ncbi:unnamed protein product [Echinostoma caproni]|uniref:MFS domain-containing protein n=1 Tax=Echinostoma caproni TaxID=27848 RepID=A0A183B628_9TREM|nr:unnamed protein product [Echinostoma caproni]
MGVFFWGYALTQYLAGYLSDRLGGEVVICLSSSIWSLTTIATLLCGSLGSYLVTAANWRTPFASIGLMFVTWSLLTYLFMVRPRRRKRSAWHSSSPVTFRIPSATSMYLAVPDSDNSETELRESKVFNTTTSSVITKEKTQLVEKNLSIEMERPIPVGKPMDWDKLLRHPPFW